MARPVLRAGALDLAFEHQHRIAHRDPDRSDAAVHVESPRLLEAEHTTVEAEGALGIGNAQGDVMDACGTVHAPIMPQAAPLRNGCGGPGHRVVSSVTDERARHSHRRALPDRGRPRGLRAHEAPALPVPLRALAHAGIRRLPRSMRARRRGRDPARRADGRRPPVTGDWERRPLRPRLVVQRSFGCDRRLRDRRPRGHRRRRGPDVVDRQPRHLRVHRRRGHRPGRGVASVVRARRARELLLRVAIRAGRGLSRRDRRDGSGGRRRRPPHRPRRRCRRRAGRGRADRARPGLLPAPARGRPLRHGPARFRGPAPDVHGDVCGPAVRILLVWCAPIPCPSFCTCC